MNDDTNKSLDVNVDNNNDIKQTVKSEISDEVTTTTGTQEIVNPNDVIFEKPLDIDNDSKPEEAMPSSPTVTSETIINTDASNPIEEKKEETGSIEEVSISVEDNILDNLDVSEVSANSVFNKKDEEPQASTLKEGQELLQGKKGFPFFMVFVLILVILAAFFIDDIVAFVEDYRNGAEVVDEEQKDEEEEEVEKVVTLEEIKTAFENSTEVIDFEKDNDIELIIDIEGNVLTFTTTNYLDVTSNSSLTVRYELNEDILTAICDISNSAFGKQISIFLVKEIAKLQGINSENLDAYINDNLYTLTIDKGFEFTNSEDGNNTYKVAINIKLDIV